MQLGAQTHVADVRRVKMKDGQMCGLTDVMLRAGSYCVPSRNHMAIMMPRHTVMAIVAGTNPAASVAVPSSQHTLSPID